MGLFDKIKNGMRRTREAFSGRMDELVETYTELEDDFYEDLTDILIMADVGVQTSELAVSRLRWLQAWHGPFAFLRGAWRPG